jgi:hypothetical protein
MGWFKTEKKRNIFYLEQILNRYQIQVYNDDGDMIYCNVHEGFTFEQACDEALIKMKKIIDISKIPTPIKFHYSGFNSK